MNVFVSEGLRWGCWKRGVEFKGGSLHDAFGGFGGSVESTSPSFYICPTKCRTKRPPWWVFWRFWRLLRLRRLPPLNSTPLHLGCTNTQPFCVASWGLFRQFYAIFRQLQAILANLLGPFSGDFRQFQGISGNFWQLRVILGHFGSLDPRKRTVWINKKEGWGLHT